MKRLIAVGIFLNAALLGGLLFKAVVADAAGDNKKEPYKNLTQEHLEILSHMSIVDLPAGEYVYDRDDPAWQAPQYVKTIRIQGVNVQIVNGEGSTYLVNGAGNLIVGYHESTEPPDCHCFRYQTTVRTGSHNVIVGSGNSYSSHSGVAAGGGQRILSPWASAVGGMENIAKGMFSFVGGGTRNWADGTSSAILGGDENQATEDYQGVLGDPDNMDCFSCDE